MFDTDIPPAYTFDDVPDDPLRLRGAAFRGIPGHQADGYNLPQGPHGQCGDGLRSPSIRPPLPWPGRRDRHYPQEHAQGTRPSRWTGQEVRVRNDHRPGDGDRGAERGRGPGRHAQLQDLRPAGPARRQAGGHRHQPGPALCLGRQPAGQGCHDQQEPGDRPVGISLEHSKALLHEHRDREAAGGGRQGQPQGPDHHQGYRKDQKIP